MKRMKSIGILLALSLVLFAGCGEQPSNKTDTTGSSEISSSEETTQISPAIEAKDYGEYEFRFVTHENDGLNYEKDEIFTEGLNGEILNDKIYERNSSIEEKYNIKISVIGNDFGIVAKSVTADEDAFDVVMPGVVNAFNYGMSGYLTDINDVPNIDPTAPWWNGNIISETSVGFKNYFLLGAMNLLSYDSTGVIFFNKAIAEENSIDDLYSLVKDGKWTFDKLFELCKKVGRDLNGDTVYDQTDMYGLALNSYGGLTFTYGTGAKFATKDVNDIPTISINESFVEFFQKFVTACHENSIMFGEKYGSNRIAYMQNAFEENRVLFLNEMLNRTSLLRSMDKDFGVLPMPKKTEAQAEYSHFVHQTTSSVIAVPVTARDLDRTGRIIEDMTYSSYVDLYPAYIEIAVKSKYLRDEESAEMVDIILDSIHFDIALLSGSSVVNELRSLLTAASPDIASRFAANAESYNERLKDLIKKAVG